MIRGIEDQLQNQASALEEQANLFASPIAIETLPNPNRQNSIIESVSFPAINEKVALLVSELLSLLTNPEEGIFIKKKDKTAARSSVDTLVRELKKELGLEINLQKDDQAWAAECTAQLIPHADYREGVSLPLQKFIFEKVLEVISGQKEVLEIDILDLPAVNLYHRHEATKDDFYQADGVSFLEYSSLSNLFALLDSIVSYAKQVGFKISLKLHTEDLTAQSLFNLGDHQADFTQASAAYQQDLQAMQQQIFASHPDLANLVEIEWVSEESSLAEKNVSRAEFDKIIADYKGKIRNFWLHSELIFQNQLKEMGLNHWAEAKKLLRAPGAADDKTKDLDSSAGYRLMVKGMLQGLEDKEFYQNLPGKDSFLAMMTPIEKERLLRQAASVTGQENLSYQELFFNDQLMDAVCEFLAKKIYFSELDHGKENISFVFGKQLSEREDPRKVVVLKPLGKASKLPADRSLAMNRADLGLKNEKPVFQAKETSATVVAQASLNLTGGLSVPIYLRLIYDDLTNESSDGQNLDAKTLNQMMERNTK